MSRVFEALQQSGGGAGIPWVSDPQAAGAAVEISEQLEFDASSLDRVPLLPEIAAPCHRLVAITDERTLGAEKIRVLGARLRSMQQQRALKKLLITSTMRDEGKSRLRIWPSPWPDRGSELC
ncbi:MAG: hypothetical protein DMG67_14095 [Acidobacteria bacterium]|nr:MAG: hypothetical protein DMG67_14095 [Acidobacteriota bacterium]